MAIKIATWNMHNRVENLSWDYLRNNLSADIALLQEANTNGQHFEEDKFIWQKIESRQFGSGIFSTNFPLTKLEFKNAHPGSLIGAKVNLPNNKPAYLFSIYAFLDKYPYSKSQPAYSSTTLHRMLSDLHFILYQAHTKKIPVILGGDFNLDVSFDEKHNSKKFGKNEHKLLLERFEDFGLIECVKKLCPKPVRTYRHTTPTPDPLQLDYIFVSNNLENKLVSCEIFENEQVNHLSDHNPVIITLDL